MRLQSLQQCRSSFSVSGNMAIIARILLLHPPPLLFSLPWKLQELLSHNAVYPAATATPLPDLVWCLPQWGAAPSRSK